MANTEKIILRTIAIFAPIICVTISTSSFILMQLYEGRPERLITLGLITILTITLNAVFSLLYLKKKLGKDISYRLSLLVSFGVQSLGILLCILGTITASAIASRSLNFRLPAVAWSTFFWLFFFFFVFGALISIFFRKPKHTAQGMDDFDFNQTGDSKRM
jgi:hypothetical protein